MKWGGEMTKNTVTIISVLLVFLLFGGTNAPFLMLDFVVPKAEMLYYVVFQQTVYAQTKITLQDGTRITITLRDKVSSETSSVGQIVNFEVSRDVMVNGKTVIKAGTPVYGEVTGVVKKGRVGQAGTVSMSISYTKSVDDQSVPLRATLSKTGEEKLGTAIGLSIVLCPLFLLKKGEEAEYNPGTQFEVFVNTPVQVEVQ